MSTGQGGPDFTAPTDDAQAPAPAPVPNGTDTPDADVPGTAGEATADADPDVAQVVDDAQVVDAAAAEPVDAEHTDGAHAEPAVDVHAEPAVDVHAEPADADAEHTDDVHAEPVGDVDDEEFDPEALGSGRAGKGPAPQEAPKGGLGPGEAAERFGHLVRHYRMGVSGAALALAWARQENAPDGATVVVEREVSPLGRLGRVWTIPPESTLSCAIVLRPPLKIEEAEATWLLAAVAVAEGAEAVSGRTLATWWPDLVVDAETGDQIAAMKVEIQLGPGKVKSAVASIRIDLDRLGVGAEGRDAVLEALLGALDRYCADLGDGAAGVAAAYDSRFGMAGRRVKLTLLPKGEARGLAKGVDRSARLQLESATGMVQKVGIDTLRAIEAV